MPHETKTTPAGAEVPARSSLLLRLWNHGVDGLAALGTLMIVVLMAMIFADVLARNLVGGSLPLISELGALTLVMIVFLQLGTTIRNDRLARTEFFLDALETRWPRLAALFTGIWHLFGIAVCAGIAWSTWGILGRDLSARAFIGVPGVATLPIWPFRSLILLGIGVATLQFVVQAVIAFSRVLNRGGAGR